MTHTRKEYENFDKTIDEYLDLWDVETKEELKIFMTNAGFHRERISGVTEVTTVHPKQLDYAWRRFQSKFKQAELPVVVYYKEYIYGKRKIRKLTIESKEINNKTYRKGQFIPKE